MLVARKLRLLEVFSYFGNGWCQRAHEIDLVRVQGDRAGLSQSSTAQVNISVERDTRYCQNVAAEVSGRSQCCGTAYLPIDWASCLTVLHRNF